MGPESQRDKAANTLQGDLTNYTNTIKGANTNVVNRFDNLNLPFDFKKTSDEINKLTTSALDKVNRTADSDIKEGQSDLASSLASQGIVGGSVLNAGTNKIRTGTNKNRFDAITGIEGDKSNLLMNAMKDENAYSFNKAKAASDVDFSNISAMLQKLGLLGNSYGSQAANLNNLNDDTWLDSILSIVNTASGVANPLTKLLRGGATSGGGK